MWNSLIHSLIKSFVGWIYLDLKKNHDYFFFSPEMNYELDILDIMEKPCAKKQTNKQINTDLEFSLGVCFGARVFSRIKCLDYKGSDKKLTL